MNVLIQRCKEMPRKREPEGRPKMFNTLPSDIAKQEAYLHANPPKGIKKIDKSFILLQIKYFGFWHFFINFCRNKYCPVW